MMQKTIRNYDGYRFSKDIRSSFESIILIGLGILLSFTCVVMAYVCFYKLMIWGGVIFMLLFILSAMLMQGHYVKLITINNRMWYHD